MRIGVFGGSFNPIHNAHIALAHNLLEFSGLDEIWMLVSPQNPFKQQEDLMPDNIRLELVRKSLEGETRLKACDYEMHRPKPSYMWNTLQAMRNDWPEHSFTLIIGSDNWERFHEWHHAADILDKYPILMYPRPGSRIDADRLPANVTLADTPQMDVSSTDVRRLLQTGGDITGLVPQPVADFFMRHHRLTDIIKGAARNEDIEEC